VLLIFISGCSRKYVAYPVHASDVKPMAGSGEPALKYRASIDIFKKHFSGILLYKKTDSLSSHIVFVTELGMKIFDFEIKADSFRLISAFPGFDSKPHLIEMLKKDLGLIFQTSMYSQDAEKRKKGIKANVIYRIPYQKTYAYYFIDAESKQPVRAYEGNWFRNKVKVRYENYSNGVAGGIILKHIGLPVRMNLTLIQSQ
jgi:hypothetical protein